jgi:hypothetical protein
MSSGSKTTQPSNNVNNEIPMERAQFQRLLAQNPNYFGNMPKGTFKAIKEQAANTQFEELTCVGYNPEKNVLEATIAVKLSFGYGGNLCSAGTTEYVRFFLDYGSGWEDAGIAGVKVHDIPLQKDCDSQPDKPLMYIVSMKLDPKTHCCDHPTLPKVHAILSWQWIPPAGAANVGWIPPWGNTLDCNIQIKPYSWNIFCLLETLSKNIGQKIELPPLFEDIKFDPIPVPGPPPLTIAELAKYYGTSSGGSASKDNELKVEPRRFAVQDLHAAISSSNGFISETVLVKAAAWESLGLDWASAVAALNETKANTSYEEIECLGLDEIIPEKLVATFRIKRPTGYSGDLCQAGSLEYIAFWADWDNKCEWTYLGTVKVNVHDIKSIPRDGLCYSAILPVNLEYERRHCSKPKVGRVRAVLSWAVPPSTVDPDQLNYWGNRLDAHVQINPGDVGDPKYPKIRNIGGIAIEDILTTTTGTTVSTAVFAHHPAFKADALGRDCPFGGQVKIEGNFYVGYYYRVKVHKIGEPYSSFTVLADSFLVERSDIGYDSQVASGGFFAYLDPLQHIDNALAYWPSSGDAKWDVQLDVATAPNDSSIISSSSWYIIQLDNTAPHGPPSVPLTMDIHINPLPSGSGDCRDVNEGDTFDGTFIADDAYFGSWSLSTLPNTVSTPSNQPTVLGLLNTDPAPAPSGHAWSLNTGSPIAMHPCGYVVQLGISDRSIVNSFPSSHNYNHIEVGFCLRKKVP